MGYDSPATYQVEHACQHQVIAAIINSSRSPEYPSEIAVTSLNQSGKSLIEDPVG